MADNAGLGMKARPKTPRMCDKLLGLDLLFISFPVQESYHNQTPLTDKSTPRN
jgi:hypothetical protein